MSGSLVDKKYFETFKRKTVEKWAGLKLNHSIYGFQIQQGTRWNPGLTNTQIIEYEKKMCIAFPDDYKCMLSVVNGTDLATLNVYGNSGEPHRTSVGVYSYPKDLEIIEERINEVRKEREEITTVLLDQGFELEKEAGLVPIYSHRFVVCEKDSSKSTVLSISGKDAIVYGNSLREYLEKEFL